MKIGFYIPNNKFSNIDCRNVAKGNPGIGGTWHLFFIVASSLAQRNNGIDVFVYVQNITNKLPESSVQYIQVKDEYEALRNADYLEIDYFVINSNIEWNPIFNMDFASGIRLIPWCHNFCTLSQLKKFSDYDRICKIVNVSREQMDLYRDHVAFSKMEYIYNCVPFQIEHKEIAIKKTYGNRNHIVTYMGSLVPDKSFHVLASIWPDVLKEVPDSQLYIIGSGKLYNQDAKLGQYKIADSSYESRFMKYLTDSNGDILPSVHFMGKMGNEKFDILLKTKVGVPNPTGNTETFCLSAVEMQYAGCAVTAMQAPGYYDTFINGEIVKNRNNLVDSIVRLLKSNEPPVAYSGTYTILEKKFGIDIIVSQWELLLLNMSNNNLHPIIPVVNVDYRYKWLKEKLRICKANRTLLSFLPSVEYFLDIKESVVKKIMKLTHLDQ